MSLMTTMEFNYESQSEYFSIIGCRCEVAGFPGESQPELCC